MEIISLTPENIADYGVCGYKDVKKHVELRHKIEWFEKYYPLGLRIQAAVSKKGGYQGMIEYIPGQYAHRPVDARDYMFIHCLFVGFKNEYKGKGYASTLIRGCLDEAKTAGMHGAATVTRKGPFMAHNDIFLKLGFEIVDSAEPDFDLLAIKFDPQAESPKFKRSIGSSLDQYGQGVTVIRSVQCPYTEKNVNAILESAIDKFNLKAELIDLEDAEAAQNSPCAFGTFCIIYNGEIISHHPISATRFENIMNKKVKAQ